ncbi:O-acetyl-ADP-ribose deacetylase [compost metagenome]|jgi:O-acetyl-ADP-ribose deacetylase (regulator of RNase III)|uniref:O-acetyl-ADP-ribose deacetylase n=1 Tax=Lelliottia aquatilis TaxID=2080838 RepID=UPI000FAA71EA|nr:O-acetyl-ADP-ribose deacetylase [Lelliottia aquatilis]MBL5884093.1 O-acetyl-ADP-ribose deacetylase [Lelliottia aquatilis]
MKPQIEVVLGDITTQHVDVIVNAANPSLMGGGGVDGAIHRAAGPQLLEACKVVRQHQSELAPGHAVITVAGDLPAKAVIHAVGPVWQGGENHEARSLEDAYLNSLRLAAANGYKTLAFPAISTGVYGFPKAAAAAIAVATVSDYLTRKPLPERVYFVCYDEENAQLYQRLLTQREQELGA